MNNKLINQIALLLTVIGAINWGLVALFNVNLVTSLLGSFTQAVNAVYVLISVAALWVAFAYLLSDHHHKFDQHNR